MYCCCRSQAWLLQHLAGMPARKLYKPLSCALASDNLEMLLQGQGNGVCVVHPYGI